MTMIILSSIHFTLKLEKDSSTVSRNFHEYSALIIRFAMAEDGTRATTSTIVLDIPPSILVIESVCVFVFFSIRDEQNELLGELYLFSL